MLWRSLLVLSVVASTGCTVVHPRGWQARGPESLRIRPTPFVMYGSVPWSWDLPDGRSILVDVDRASVLHGLGLYRADIAFDVAFSDDATGRVRCATEPEGPEMLGARFACWSSSSDPEPVRFWMAPGQDCPTRHSSVVRTLTTPACWNGRAVVGAEELFLRHGHLESTGSPVGYVSWLDDSEQPLLHANIVSEAAIRVYEPGHPVPMPEASRRRLLLLTVALAWWEHASNPDA